MPVPELDRILICLLFADPPPTNILAILMNLCCLFCLYLFLRSIHIICLLLSFRATSRALAFPIPGWQPWSMREMVIAKLRHNTTRRERYISWDVLCACEQAGLWFRQNLPPIEWQSDIPGNENHAALSTKVHLKQLSLQMSSDVCAEIAFRCATLEVWEWISYYTTH